MTTRGMNRSEPDISIEKITRPVFVARATIYREGFRCSFDRSCAPCPGNNPACISGDYSTISKTFLTRRSAEKWAAKKVAFSELIKDGYCPDFNNTNKDEKNKSYAIFLHAVNSVSRRFFNRDIFYPSYTCTQCGWRGFHCETVEEDVYRKEDDALPEYFAGHSYGCPECGEDLSK